MNFKRVLVLVMALMMVATVCAPSIFATRNTETKHEHLDVLENPELLEKYEEIKAVVEAVAKDIEENHEEYYANGYAYALENGYIDGTIGAIKEALVLLPQIDLSGVEMSDEMRERLEVEIDALTPTLEKLVAILESGEADNFDGFVNAALTLEGDLYTHLNNIYAILEQANIEYLTPAFNYAMDVIENQVIPAIEETVNAYVDAVVDYVVDALAPYYNKAVEVIGIARDTYNSLVETIVKINLFVENSIAKVVETYNALILKLVEIQGKVEDAVNIACDVYNKVIATVAELNACVEGVIGDIENIIVATVNVYNRTVELLIKTYGSVEDAIKTANEIYDYTVSLIKRNVELVKAGLENGAMIVADIVDIIKRAPGEANAFADYVAAQITAYIVGMINDLDAFVAEMNDDAFNANYELVDNSLYVAIGEAPYGEELAEKLNLHEKKYFQFGIRDKDNYLAKVASADLVTIKFDGDELSDFAGKQVAGTVANVIRSNEKLIEFYNHPIIGGYVASVVAGAGIDINAQTETLNWNLYLNAEDQEMLRNVLGFVREQLIAEGVPEYHYIDLQPMVEEALIANGLAGLPGISITLDPIEVPVADIAVYAIESALYAYARYAHDVDALLESIYTAAPNATVVLLGVDNPLEGITVDLGDYGVDFVEYDDCAKLVDMAVKAINAKLYFAAADDENTVFVIENDADAIYSAIHVHCEHVYDDCVDSTCNRCLEVRKAPGHSFTSYTSNNDATCTKDGSVTYTCDYCDATNVVVVKNSKKPHTWKEATCTSVKTCLVCKTTSGTTLPHNYKDATCTTPEICRNCFHIGEPALGHEFTEWETIVAATKRDSGYEERVCSRCGLKETHVLPIIPPKHATSTIILVIVSAIVFAAAVSGFILWRLRKADILKD